MKYKIDINNHLLEWTKNYLWHRLYGSALEHEDGGKSWWQDGRIHREDGPAIEYEDNCKEWWINDIEYTEEEFKRIYRRKIKKNTSW